MITFIDLFAGIGGFRIGIQRAFDNRDIETKCVFSCDIKDHAIRVYNKNFKEENKKCDVSKLDINNLVGFDILCGGFPCQSFSTAGNKQGFQDKRGLLIFDVINICKAKQPKLVILENVPNLENIENGKLLSCIVAEFCDIGYCVSHTVLNACDFGIPQNRKRLFIVCCLDKTIDLNDIKKNPPKTLGDIIDYSDCQSNIPKNFYNALVKLPEEFCHGKSIKDKRGGANNLHSWDLEIHGTIDNINKTILNKLLTERRKKHWAEKKGIKWQDGMPLTLSEISTFIEQDDLENRLENLVEIGYLVKEKPKDLVSGKRVVKEDCEIGYNINKGKLSFPLTKIMHPKEICPTLTATDSNKLGIRFGNTIRTLNKNELKRVCGFPEDYDVSINSVNYYDLFGNMVCPPVVEALMNHVLDQFSF